MAIRTLGAQLSGLGQMLKRAACGKVHGCATAKASTGIRVKKTSFLAGKARAGSLFGGELPHPLGEEKASAACLSERLNVHTKTGPQPTNPPPHSPTPTPGYKSTEGIHTEKPFKTEIVFHNTRQEDMGVSYNRGPLLGSKGSQK